MSDSKKELRTKWIEMANQQAKNKILRNQEEQQLKMIRNIDKQQQEIKKMLTIQSYIDRELYLTALKYIHTHYPEFTLKKPKIYNWLKKAAHNNNLNNNNLQNVKQINISNFKASEGNAYENVNVYELFNTNKKGGIRKTYRKKKSSRKTHKKRN